MSKKFIDQKNIGLAKAIYRLRQDSAVFRIIGINVDELTRAQIGLGFFSHISGTAQQAVAIGICKVYEDEGKRWSLNSLPGLLSAIRQNYVARPTDQTLLKLIAKYRCKPRSQDWLESATRSFHQFTQKHNKDLTRFRTFRDKFVCHSESGYNLSNLPSIGVSEELVDFAYDFYCLVSESVLDVGAASIDEQAGMGLIKLMENIGISDPRYDFDHAGRLNRRKSKT